MILLLALFWVVVPRNNCIIKSRTRKNIIYLPFSVLHQNLGTVAHIFYRRRSCTWYPLFWTRATRRNLRNKNTYILHLLSGACVPKPFQRTCCKVSSCLHRATHPQSLRPGPPITAAQHYCPSSSDICLTKLESGKWNAEILKLKLRQDQSRINKLL